MEQRCQSGPLLRRPEPAERDAGRFFAVTLASSATSAPRAVSTTSASRASLGFDSRVTRPIRSSGASCRAIPEVVTASRRASSTRRRVCAGADFSSSRTARSLRPRPWWPPSGWSTSRRTSVRARARSRTRSRFGVVVGFVPFVDMSSIYHRSMAGVTEQALASDRDPIGPPTGPAPARPFDQPGRRGRGLTRGTGSDRA